MLAVVMLITGQHYTLNVIRHRYDVSVAQGNVQRMLEEHREGLREQQEIETDLNRQAEAVAQSFVNGNRASDNINSQNRNTEQDISDEDAFLYAKVFFMLVSLGYDVFPAFATLSNGEEVRGFGFTAYEDIFTRHSSSYEMIYIGTGFLAILGERVITEDEVEEGVIITPVEIESEEENDSNINLEEVTPHELLLSFSLLNWGRHHYISYGQYVIHGIDGHNIWRESVPNCPSKYDLSLGFLMDYDLGRAIYDPALGQEFNPNGFNITQGIDYDLAIKAYRDIIFNQNQAKIILDTISFTTIEISALNAFLISNQREEFVGVPASQIHFIEMNMHDSVFYYICGVTGEIGFIQIPPDLQMGWKEWLSVSLAAVGVVVGVIMVATGVLAIKGAGLTALSVKLATSMLMGVAMVANNLNQMVMTTTGQPLFNSQFLAGSMQVVSGGTMISAGSSLAKAASGPFGMFLAVLQITVGALQVVLGATEMVDHVFDFNWLTDGLGLSEEFYRAFSTVVNVAATVVVISTGIYKWHQSRVAAKAAQNIELLDNGDIVDGKGNVIGYRIMGKYREFESFAAFKEAMGSAGEEMAWHHIVEKSQIKKSGFTEQSINNTDNIIALKRQGVHTRVTGIFNGAASNFVDGAGPGSLRNWLIDQPFDIHLRIGMDALREIGVILWR